jgi:hypothetical protein
MTAPTSLMYDVIGEHERTVMNRSGGLVLRFKVDDLLKELRTNRADHEKIFNEAMTGFKKAFKKKLVELSNALEKGQTPQPNLGLTVPTNSLAQYDTAIKMLDLTTESELELTQDQFNCYVMDQWHFQQNFLRSAMMYDSNSARMKFMDAGE